MNTVANDEACLSIKAKHIGPIMELEGKLSPKGQNLLFATSGTGKSFISRALRALDGPIEEGEKDIDPADVVSEESSDGALSLLEGTAEITKIAFDKIFGLVTRSPSQYNAKRRPVGAGGHLALRLSQEGGPPSVLERGQLSARSSGAERAAPRHEPRWQDVGGKPLECRYRDGLQRGG